MSTREVGTQGASATFEATLECGKDNKEGQCCCWTDAAVKPGDVQYGHTYTFSPVRNPSIDVKASAGPCEQNQEVPIDVYALPTDGTWDSPGDWRKAGTINVLAQCPNRPPHTETTVDIDGDIKGVLLGSSNNTVDVSTITVHGEKAGERRKLLLIGGVAVLGATTGYLLMK